MQDAPQAVVDESRSPHGERGLKYPGSEVRMHDDGRSPHGERGLKLGRHVAVRAGLGRSPHGERGLKCKACFRGGLTFTVALLMESVD